jgi:hypothetical protein
MVEILILVSGRKHCGHATDVPARIQAGTQDARTIIPEPLPFVVVQASNLPLLNRELQAECTP